MKNTNSIKAWLRSDRKDENGKCRIYWLVYIGKVQFKVATGLAIEEKYWDKARGEVNLKACKGLSISYRDIADAIDKGKVDYRNFCRSIELSGKPLTIENVKAFFGDSRNVNSFLGFIEDKIVKKYSLLSKVTLQKYKSTLALLRDYKKDVSFDEVTLPFLQDFEYFLRSEKMNNDGGLDSRMRNLKAIVNDAIEEGFIKVNPFKNYQIPKARERKDYLTEKQFNAIADLVIPEEKWGLGLTRDLFIFCCNTGLRFSDVKRLKRSEVDVDAKLLKKVQQKTNGIVEIGLSNVAIELIKKYENSSNMVFPPISNSQANIHLKTLADMAKLNLNFSLTFHYSRHTFGTTLVNNSVGINVVSKLMGHRNLKDTMRYAKTTTATLVAAVDCFNNKANSKVA